MIRPKSASKTLSRALAVLALPALLLGGCADMGDAMTQAFADPAKYELWDCKQLEPERKNLANKAAELQGLMAKAETGVAGPVVAELAYRNEYLAIRGQAHFAEEAWLKNKCRETPPNAPAAPVNAKPAAPANAKSVAPSKARRSVY